MKTRYLAATAAAALAFGALVPATAASAADTTISGTVEGVGGAESSIAVGWIEAGAPENYFETVTDSDGEYTLDIPEGIDYYIYANLEQEGDGSADQSSIAYTGAYLGQGGQQGYLPSFVEPYTEQLTGDFDIFLDQAGVISGVNAAYANTDLFLENLGKAVVTDTVADSDGAFEFAGLVPGKYRISAYRSGKFVEYRSSTITVQSGTVATATLSPKVGGTLSGTVKSGGKKLKGIEVYVSNSADYSSAVTNSSGKYTVKGLASGTYYVTFVKNGSGTSYVAKTTKKKITIGKASTLSATLSKAGAVSGKVSLTSGATSYTVAIVNAKNVAVGYDSGDSSHKSFSVKSLSSGKYTAYVTDSKGTRYGSKSFSVKSGKTKSVGTIKLSKKTLTLSGKVTGATGGSVYAGSTFTGGNSSISSSGKYSIKGLVPGKYTVYTYANGTDVKLSSVTLKKSTTKNLTKGAKLGTLTGTILAGGFPASEVYGWYESGKNNSFSFEAYDGVLSVQAPAGKATLGDVSVSPDFPGLTPYWYEFPTAAKSITITGGKTTKLGTFELVLKGIEVNPIP